MTTWSTQCPSPSIQDLFDAPAAEEEIEALLNRLNETVGKVSSQEVLAPAETHGHVPQVLSQGGGGHGLGKRTLGMHCSGEERGVIKQKQEGGQSMKTGGEVWQIGLDPAHATAEICSVFPAPSAPLLITSYVNHRLPPFTSCVFQTLPCFQTFAGWLKALFTFAVYCSPLLCITTPPHSLWALTIPESAPFCCSLVCSQTGEFQQLKYFPVLHPTLCSGSMWQVIIISRYVLFNLPLNVINSWVISCNYIKRQTHKERWMIYVFIYAIYIFRYRCKQTCFPKNKKKY